MAKIFVFGSNREGQAGIAHQEDCIINPTDMSNCSIDLSRVCRVIATQKQTYFCENDGSVSSCGENDAHELGRAGKRSILLRLDSLEAFQFADIAAGEQFVLLACRDGKVVSWGRNELGQLGLGNRDNKEKPRLSNIIADGVLQISAGSQHVVCLSHSGDVYTWGGNRKGQLGDGQLTSCFTPKVVPQLKHRPVVAIACGEGHSMVMTIGGNVYAWGDNSCGQLGVGDTVHRLVFHDTCL
jgi:alpha-tubulin suppressor-like RCC1 family protein